MELKLNPVRCPHCGKLICEADGVIKKKCPRCKQIFTYDTKTKKYISR
nr:MAG TPA: DNA-directed RNA polymerase II subunit [Caudoviricetes sp.]